MLCVTSLVVATGLDDVISTGREQIAVATAQKLQDYLNVYDSGINVVKINIEQARPPTQVQEAYDDVIGRARRSRALCQ